MMEDDVEELMPDDGGWLAAVIYHRPAKFSHWHFRLKALVLFLLAFVVTLAECVLLVLLTPITLSDLTSATAASITLVDVVLFISDFFFFGLFTVALLLVYKANKSFRQEY